MSEPNTVLGLERIDPDGDDYRDSWGTINRNADVTTELILEDRARISNLASQVGGAEALAGTVPAAGEGPVTVGDIRVMPGVDARYAAFPGSSVLADGRVMVVWREGTDHVTARDGIVRATITEDNGVSWSPATTPLSMPGTDLRDPCLALSRDKTKLHLTYFKGSAANAAEGFFLRTSYDQGETYGPEVRIDASPYAAGCSPIVELPDGQLVATWYGKDATTDARDSVYVATSPDGGTTWGNRVKLLDGVADGRDYQEPYAATYGANLVIMYRHGGTENIGIITSANGGATWSAGRVAFAGTGRPGFTFTSRGTLVVIYRASPGTYQGQHGYMRYSRDLGATWSQAYLLERANPQWWNYSAPIEVTRGQVLVPTTTEYSSTSSKLSFRYVTEGGGISPLGDISPTGARRVLERTNSVAVYDDFDRPNGPLVSSPGIDWLTTGNGSIVDGALQSGVGAAGLHIANALTPDVDVEADLQWSGTAGAYIIFRYQNASNYLYAGVETNGTAMRIYKVIGGAAPVLVGTAATIAAPAGYFHRYRVTAVGANLRAYFEDSLVISASDASLSTMPWVGLRMGGTVAGTLHRAKYFLARRRTGISS